MALRGHEGTGVKGREAERKLVSLGSIPISSEAGVLGGAQGCLLQPVRGVCRDEPALPAPRPLSPGENHSRTNGVPSDLVAQQTVSGKCTEKQRPCDFHLLPLVSGAHWQCMNLHL